MERNGYTIKRLSDVVTYLNRGVSPSYSNSGTLVLNQKCIRERVSFDEARYTDSSKKKISNEKYLQQYDIVICSTGVGTLGRVGQIDNPITNTTTDSHVTIVRPSPEIVNPTYLGYVLKSKQKEIEFLAEGSTGQTELSRIKLSNLEIPLPPLSSQHRIANILSSFDNKIELLRKENNTLEDIAQSIFKEWFVKYNFPNKDGEPYRDNNGKMIDSELGLIPEGWRVDHIGKYINIKGGGTPSTKEPEYWNGDLNWTTPKDLSNLDGLFLLNSGTKITPLGLKQISSGLLPKGTLLLSSRAPIGYLAFAEVETAINQGFIAFLPNSYLPNIYMYIWLKRNMKSIEGIANGSTFMEVNKENLKNFEMIIPTEDILQKFISITSNMFNEINKSEFELSILKRSKTALLHKLIQS